MFFLVEREWALVGGQLREGVRNGSNRSHPLHWGRFVRLCLSLGGCVFAERTLREIGWMVIHTYSSVAWIVKYDDPYRDPNMNTRIIGLDDEFRSFWIEDFGGMEILWGCGMAKKEEGLCVGESNREWQETAPCNEIQTVAIYSTHFSLQATTGKLQCKNI